MNLAKAQSSNQKLLNPEYYILVISGIKMHPLRLLKGISAMSSKRLKSCPTKFPKAAEAKRKQKIPRTE